MQVPHGAIVLAVDGGRMRLLRNRGRAGSIELETIAERVLDNPLTHELSEPQPGRRFESSGPGRSAYSEADAHAHREDVFCAEALDRALAETGDGELILIAPPKVLGRLRKRLAQHRKLPAVRELGKDLSALSPHELALRLRDRW